ncbi:sensor histidine kinase N-terminal domain-containing protein [Halomonas saccharevitans]|uniref:histidine kinase n=1 Tax=Halomonas saccharevitans TaxID=416872 RepID=A0ABU3NG91_9GAMM|nr:sensor histidine kinase N-terminal domain-containing protein [Halomonas saccharevitans]MDT8880097.1 sensor histidine kinase N-terminal domain-containing protein [Halomonas saccharevitans]
MIEVTGSLKRRLAVWLLVTVTGLGALLMIEAWVSSQRAAERAYDSQLEAAALTIAEAVQWQQGEPLIEVPAAALQILATRHQERVFYAVLDADGEAVSANLPFAIEPGWRERAAAEPLALTARLDGEAWRLYGREVDSAGWVSQEPVQVWVGHTRAGRMALADELFERTLTRFVAMVLLAGVLMALALRVALGPMRRLRRVLRRRDADDMRPLDARVPEEMRELAQTLDHLFARQRQSREALLRFTADASHQLKTPLAGLQSVSELALASEDPADWQAALAAVHEGAGRTSRLAGQLLSLARLRHLGEADEVAPLDLAAVLRETVLDWAGREAARDHDLGLAELPAGPVWVRAEGWAIRELLGNLIDNALRYTPPGSVITLGLERLGGLEVLKGLEGGDPDRERVDEVALFVEDDGPGVAEEARERLLQPFERGGRQDTDGSGLGLSIVDSIAHRLGGRLVLAAREPHGLVVRLHLPLCDPEEAP